MLNQNLKCEIIFLHGLDRHSPPQGDNIGNLDDLRRTRSDFQREGIVLSCPNNLFSETCYLMINSDPNSYYHDRKDPRWKVAMDEEMNSVQKNTTWELVSLPSGRKLVQCKWVFQIKVAADSRSFKYRQGWWQKVSLRSKVWTTMRLLHRLQKWTPSA